MTEYLDNQLKILNLIFKNSIQNDESVTELQIPKIKPRLFPHQVATINEMSRKMQSFTTAKFSPMQIISRLGILGNSENSGKTLTVLGLLALMENMQLDYAPLLSTNSSNFFYSIETQKVDNSQNEINLIVVPNYLFSQWENTIKTDTTLDFSFIDSKKSLNMCQRITPHFLVSAKLYKNFHKFCEDKRLTWRITFFDEIQNIYINELSYPSTTKFTWFSTSNWLPLIFKQSYFSFKELTNRIESQMSHMYFEPELCTYLRKHKKEHVFLKSESSLFLKNIMPYNNPARTSLLVRCADDFIENSMKIIKSQMNITIQSRLCRPSISLFDMRLFFQENNSRMDHLMPLFYKDLEIQFIKDSQINHTIYSDDCPICLETPQFSAISKCCRHTYCGGCLLKNTILRGVCPLCRKNNTISDIMMLDNPGFAMNEYATIRNKVDTTLQFILDNSGDRILIISSHKNILYNLFEKAIQMNIQPQIIDNKTTAIKNNILFMTYSEGLSGLKIHNITQIVIISDLFEDSISDSFMNYLGLSPISCKVTLMQETWRNDIH